MMLRVGVGLLWAWPAVGARAGAVPEGCGPGLAPLYWALCDLGAVWGVVVEAFAAAGAVSAVLLLLVLLASLPFAEGQQRGVAGLQAGLLTGVIGLFGLSFACVVGPDFATCAARRFLWGVLFAGCFSCLLAHGAGLSWAARRGGRRPGGGPLCLAALALWLVEVVVNAEWLILTEARYPPNATAPAAPDTPTAPDTPSTPATPCAVDNPDFAAALTYVMALLLAAALAPLPALLSARGRQCRREAAFVLSAAVVSAGLWAAWIAMYVYGNRRHGDPGWDDPTLAIALVSNGWALLALYTVPGVCALTRGGPAPPGHGDQTYPPCGVGYENILKEQAAQNMFMENKAFSMDEPNTAQKPVSPYSGYAGQLRSSVYQPTELALITKGGGNQADLSYETVLPRASPPSQNSSPSPQPDQAPPSNGNGLHRKVQW